MMQHLSAAFPGPLGRFFNRLLLAVTDPADTQCIAARKTMLVGTLSLIILLAPRGAYWCFVVATGGADGPALPVAIAGVVLFHFSALLFAVSRWAGTVSNALWSCWVLTVTSSFVLIGLCTPTFPATLALVAIMQTVVFTDDPWLAPHVTYVGAALAAMIYRDTFRGESYAPQALPGVLDAHPTERAEDALFGVLFAAYLVITQRLQAVVRQAGLDEMTEGIHVSTDVSNLLHRYDTDRAAEVLNSYEARSSCNRELLRSQRALVTNLERYRPHLPNWVLEEGDATEEVLALSTLSGHRLNPEEDTPMGLREVIRQLARVQSTISSACSSPPPEECDRHARIVDVGAIDNNATNNSNNDAEVGNLNGTQMHSMKSHHSTPLASRRASTPRDPSKTQVSTDSKVTTVDSKTSDGDLRGARIYSEVHREPTHCPSLVYSGVVSMALFDFSSDRTGLVSTELIHRTVDVVHRVAAATHAAVHSFIGDQCQLTWNATKRSSRSPSKLCALLWSLRQELEGVQGLFVSGAGMAGTARCHPAGYGRQQAMIVSAEWTSELAALSRFARRQAAFLVDGRVHDAAQYDVVLRGVAALSTQPIEARIVDPYASSEHLTLPPHITRVYEVVGPRSEANDEWMYVIRRNESNPNEVCCRALQHAVEGNFHFARIELQRLEALFVAASPLVRLLRTRVERCCDMDTPSLVNDFCLAA